MTVVSDRMSMSIAVAETLTTDPEDVPGVVDRLRALQPILESGPRGARDGLACFTVLYERITSEIAEQLGDQDLFRDPEFVSRLDVEFARRYFAALRADATGATPPRSWRVLFEKRDHPCIGPMEFAVAGVNAHVNYDLAQAVVRTLTVLGRPGPGGTEQADYQAVNAVFARHMSRLREHFAGLVGHDTDPTCPEGLLDGAGNLTVVMARDATWRRTEHLWNLRSRPAEYERECEAVDWRAAMMGRGVLSLAVAS